MSTRKDIEELKNMELEKGFSKSVLNTLQMAYRPYFARILGVVIIGLLGRGLILANTNLIGLWVDHMYPQQKHAGWFSKLISDWQTSDFILALSVLCAAGFALTLCFRTLFSRFSAKAVSQIYDEVTLRTSRFPQSYFDQNTVGKIITRFSSDYGNVFRLFGGPLAEFLSILFDIAMMVILITVASPWYLLAVLMIAVMNYIVFRYNRDQLRKVRRELSQKRSPSISHFAETTQGASTIRTFQRQQPFTHRFRVLDDLYIHQKNKTVGSNLLFSFQMNSLSAILLLMTGLGSYALLQEGLVSVGSIGVAFGFIIMSGNTIQMFFEWLSQIEDALIGVERLDRFLRSDTEPGHRLPYSTQFKTSHWTATAEEEALLNKPLTHKRSASVDFKNVWFRYDKNLPWVLKDVSFSIQAGEKIGVIGKTGSGKSSLIQSLFYLYPIDQGEVSIDGYKPQLTPQSPGVDLLRYRHLISSISQDPILFQGTLKENLTLTEKADDTEIWEALRRVGLEDWIRNEPFGLNFPIEERGRNLSVGEKQLICMARALLLKAPLVVMDEATASIDPQSEEILVQATEDFFKDRTQIIIAHRLSTLVKCQKVLWIDQGQVKMFDHPKRVIAEFEKNHF